MLRTLYSFYRALVWCRLGEHVMVEEPLPKNIQDMLDKHGTFNKHIDYRRCKHCDYCVANIKITWENLCSK